MKTLLAIAAFVLSATASLAAEVPIDIEVALTPDAPITAPQTWAARLGKLGLARVQIRSARGEEKPATTLSDDKSRVEVLAVLTGNDELVMYDRKFRASQISDLKEYFANLPTQIAEEGIVRGPFGLTEQEFTKVMADMGKPLGFSAKGLTSHQLLAHCARQFRMKIEWTAPAYPLLQNAKPLEMELDDFASGTALAIALRSDGLTIRPEHEDKLIKLVVAPYERGKEAWPAGWKAEQSPRQLAPKLFESLTVEIENYTLTAALNALAPRLTVPVVMDSWILTQLGIEPAKIPVKLPAKKTFLLNAVNKMLSQARLASELRIDDAGMAFLWVTQYGPDSRPAR